jgi:hypothetical protein
VTFLIPWWSVPVCIGVVGGVIALFFPRRSGGHFDFAPLFGCGLFLLFLVLALVVALWMKP